MRLLVVELREMLCVAGAGDGGLRIAGAARRRRAAARWYVNEWIGRRDGPVLDRARAGRGGMGIVFEASRRRRGVLKTVALKVGARIDERFRTERQILAGLEHLHIARFLEGGSEGGVLTS